MDGFWFWKYQHFLKNWIMMENCASNVQLIWDLHLSKTANLCPSLQRADWLRRPHGLDSAVERCFSLPIRQLEPNIYDFYLLSGFNVFFAPPWTWYICDDEYFVQDLISWRRWRCELWPPGLLQYTVDCSKYEDEGSRFLWNVENTCHNPDDHKLRYSFTSL